MNDRKLHISVTNLSLGEQMNTITTVDTQVSNMMYLIALFMVMTLSLYFAVLLATGRGIGFFPMQHRTQRQRYVMLMFAQVLIGVPVLYTLNLGGLDSYLNAVDEWSSVGTFVSGVYSWLAMAALMSPLITVLFALVVYLFPAYFAKGAGHGEFYITSEWRSKRRLGPNYRPRPVPGNPS
jgi:hypothetical protein